MSFLNVISHKIIIYDSQFKKILFMAKKITEKCKVVKTWN